MGVNRDAPLAGIAFQPKFGLSSAFQLFSRLARHFWAAYSDQAGCFDSAVLNVLLLFHRSMTERW